MGKAFQYGSWIFSRQRIRRRRIVSWGHWGWDWYRREYAKNPVNRKYLAQSEMEKINRKVEQLRWERKLQLRLYKFKKKHVRKDGTVTIGPNRQWKWVKGETKQKKYRPRGQAKTLLSKRFGYLDTYTYNERKLLICPSGYTFGQGMHCPTQTLDCLQD